VFRILRYLILISLISSGYYLFISEYFNLSEKKFLLQEYVFNPEYKKVINAETEIDFFQLNLGYILNPTTNLKLEFSLTHRNQISQQYDQKTNFYSMSLVSDLFNYYYDF